MRLAVVVGSAGQDGTLLSQLLEGRGYEVLGIERGDMDIGDPLAVANFISKYKPSEIYFLAAHHHSSEDSLGGEGELFRQSMRTHFDSPVNFLDAISVFSPASRFFYASSSHVFGSSDGGRQTEETPLQPDSCYAITKVAGMMACRHYREVKGVFASIGILYNHESPIRSYHFVTQKIVRAAVQMAREQEGSLVIGNLEAKVDWGYAPDYVNAMYQMLQLDNAQEFIIATGKGHTVREFADVAFKYVGLNYHNYIVENSSVISRENPSRIGDSSRLHLATGWNPSVSFEKMIEIMVDSELAKQM